MKKSVMMDNFLVKIEDYDLVNHRLIIIEIVYSLFRVE